MKITLPILLPMLLASLAVSALADDGGAAETRAAIETANTKFSEAFAKADSVALGALYTDDAIVFPPDQEMIQGNKAIGEFWKTTREGGVTGAVLTTLDVERSGDLAFESGKVRLTIQNEGKPPTSAAAKYVVVWKRQRDGAWKLHRDIWNDLPAPK